LNRFVENWSLDSRRKLFGLYSAQKGRSQSGSDADLVIFDPNANTPISAKTHHMRVDYFMFEGIQVTACLESFFPGPRGWMEISSLGRAGKESSYADRLTPQLNG